MTKHTLVYLACEQMVIGVRQLQGKKLLIRAYSIKVPLRYRISHPLNSLGHALTLSNE